MSSNSFLQKIKALKAKHFKKKMKRREKRIDLLKEVDAALALGSFDTYSFQNKSENVYVQKRLNKIEASLTKIKEKYNKALQKDDTEKKVAPYVTLVNILKEVCFDDCSLANKEEDMQIQKKLDKIEQVLVKKKRKYEDFILNHNKQSSKALKLLAEFEQELSSQIKKYEDKIAHLQKDNKVQKLYHHFQLTLEKNIYKVKVEIAHLNHKNKVTGDRLWWELLTKEEKKERRSDLSFYVPDVHGYWLTLLSVVSEIVYSITLLGIMDRAFWVGISILVNIAFLLFLFTIAIKVKNYKKAFAFCSIAFGIYCILRITLVIEGLMGVDLVGASNKTKWIIYGFNIYMIIASIYVGLRSFIKIKRQEIYIKEEKISEIQMSK